MAITATHYHLLCSLKAQLPRGGSLLEIGEANWYGDALPDFPCPQTGNLFAIAKAFYAALFAPSYIISIDAGGTPQALRHDLNQAIDLGEFMWCCDSIHKGPLCPCCGAINETFPIAFGVVINHGTAEHVFNVAQVFRTMHEFCAVGGLMIHDAPFTGWIDHGFYCLHPTLFYDVAAANCYEVVKVAIHEVATRQIIPLESREDVYKLAQAGGIPNNSMLFVALRKRVDAPFAIPMQGYYANTLSKAGNNAWRALR